MERGGRAVGQNQEKCMNEQDSLPLTDDMNNFMQEIATVVERYHEKFSAEIIIGLTAQMVGRLLALLSEMPAGGQSAIVSMIMQNVQQGNRDVAEAVFAFLTPSGRVQ
jgi:hypothetical protein